MTDDEQEGQNDDGDEDETVKHKNRPEINKKEGKEEKEVTPRPVHRKRQGGSRKKVRNTSDSEDIKPVVETKIIEKVVEVESEAMKAKIQRYKQKVQKLEELNSQLQQRNAELASQAGEYRGELKGLEAQVQLLKSMLPPRN